jgi:MoaA/NifB/PqqE/SkfB family radical SAM enzyme
MCFRWQKDAKSEINIDKIREVFMNPLFSEVEDVNLHGGEPFLRSDLAEICRLLQDAAPKIKRIWISTNGIGPGRIEKRVQEILGVLDFEKLESLEINVSVDGIGETHDKIRRVQGAFDQCLETIKRLIPLEKDYPLQISMGTVIQPLNLRQIDDIEKLALDLGVPIIFQPLMFDKFFNIRDDRYLNFSQEEREELKRLIESKLTKGVSTTSFYWRDFLSMMDGGKRKSPCAFDRYVFSLYPTGEVLPCSREDWILFGNVYEKQADRIWYSRKVKKIRKRMRKEVCPTCTFYCGVEFSLQKEFFTYLKYYLKKKMLPSFHQRSKS